MDSADGDNKAGSSAALVSILLENLQSAVLVEDEARRVAIANPRFCSTFAIDASPLELVGMDCREMAQAAQFSFADPQRFLSRIDEILAAGDQVEGEELRMADGRLLVRDFVPIVINGSLRGQLWQYRDISDLRAKEALNRSVIDTALDAIITIDHHGRIMEFNPAAENIFGHSRASVVGEIMGDIIVPEHLREAHRSGMARYMASRSPHILGQRLELSAVRADGTEFPVELTVTRIPDSEPPLFTGFVRDITAERTRQEQLKVARDTAEEASRAKTDFLATMSHEIRTPMNAILGMTELALDLADKTDQRDMLQSVQSNADSLLNVINDVLDLSKIESGNFALIDEVFSVGDVTESVVEALAPRAAEKGVELTCLISPSLYRGCHGDPHRLRQVLVNLIGNAVKFTDEGHVAVEVVKDDHGEADRVCFSVTDTGIGISADLLGRIFEAFFQARPSDAHRRGGTGLGLGICRSLVGLMGGRLSATSEPGSGSEFRFSIPLPGAEEPQPTRRRGDATQAGWTGLVLSPLDHVVASACTTLEGLGVHAEGCVVAGLAAALSASPRCLVLVDQRLGLRQLETVASLARGAEHEVRLAVLVPPGPQRPWRVHGPSFTRYVVKPATRRKMSDLLDPTPSLDPSRAEGRDPSPRQVGGGYRILVVEDNPENQAYVMRVLEGAGFHVDVAQDGLEGVRQASHNSYDLILADLDMPRMDGFEMAETLIQAKGEECPPIVAFTAHVVEGYKGRCFEAGMVGFLPKPARPDEILDEVRKGVGSPLILVVDDSEDSRLLLTRFLEAEGLRVEAVQGGSEALERVRMGGIDLVVLDMNMPGVDGYETARHIRALPIHADVPILASTSWVGPEEESRCLAAGCSDYLPKPVRREALVSAVLRHVRRVGGTDNTSTDRSAYILVDPTIADLVPGYLETCHGYAVQLREHLRRGELEPIRAIGHRLAGSGAPYGFPRLTELGRSLEHHAESGGTESVRSWVEELEAYLGAVRWDSE